MNLVTSQKRIHGHTGESYGKVVMENASLRRRLVESHANAEWAKVKRMKQAIEAKRTEGDSLLLDGRDNENQKLRTKVIW